MSEGRIYLDSSAVSKLLIKEEPDAELAAGLLDRYEEAHTSLLTYLETMSALTRAQRDRRLTSDELQDAVARLAELWTRFHVVFFSEQIAVDAANYILRFPLSGADAVQVASGLTIREDGNVAFVTWDRRQARAANALVSPSSRLSIDRFRLPRLASFRISR